MKAVFNSDQSQYISRGQIHSVATVHQQKYHSIYSDQIREPRVVSVAARFQLNRTTTTTTTMMEVFNRNLMGLDLI